MRISLAVAVLTRLPRLGVLCIVLAVAASVLGQIAPAPDAPPTAPISSQPSHQIEPYRPKQSNLKLRSTTNLVSLYFVARNALALNGQDADGHASNGNGALVTNLNEKDCHIYEDNVRQTMQGFSAETRLPLTLGILLDTSLSQQRVLPREQQAASAFLRQILRPGDEAFLLSFDVTVNLLADFTGSPGQLEHAMSETQINASSGNFANGTLPTIGRAKGTLLYDAVYLASHDEMRHETGRKAIIVLTNGQDEGSQENLRSAIEAAQKSDVIVYVLLISAPGIDGMLDLSGTGAMRKFAEATGGRVFRIGSDGKKMKAAFQEIESELRTQYQASYTPSNQIMDGAFRSLRVECQQNGKQLRIQARKGYYATPSTPVQVK